MSRIEYAALKYYNNIISEECLYIGMLYNNLTTGKRDFRYISNFSRLQSFDDEADIDFIKAYLEGIKQQVENNIFNYNTSFDMKEFSRFYVNEFKFSDITVIDVDDNEDYVVNLTKMFLKFDFNKKQRLSKNEEKKYIRKILSSSNVKLSEPRVSGIYNENVNFDYLIDDIAIKVFTFKEKNTLKLIPSAKQWAFSAQELKGRYRVVFLYDDDTDGTSDTKIILQILKQYAEVYRIQDGLNYVLKAVS